MVNNYQQQVYEDPRISLNKLGEYLTTQKAARRERILRDAKYPPTYQLIRYEPTKLIIQRFLTGKISNTLQLAQEIADYGLTHTKDDFEARMKKSNMEAMASFALMAPGLSFGDAKITLGPHAPSKPNISGVSISVRPELHLTTIGANIPIKRGAVKLNISKGAVHGKEAAEYVGTVLQHFIAGGCDADECDHQLCVTLDVFGKKVAQSPKATVNRMKDVVAGCAEIARQWDSISPD